MRLQPPIVFFCAILICTSAYSVEGCDENSKEWCEAYDLVERVAAADRQLNEVYKKLTAQLTATQKKSVIAAQRAWLAFRKLDCEVPVDLLNEIGSPATHRGVHQECMLDRTEQRIRELALYCRSIGECN